MADLIELIFHHEEEDYRGVPGHTDAQRILDDYHGKIEKAFGFDFMDGLATAEARICSIETQTAYRHGFRLSGRLLLELFSSRP